MQLKAGMQGVLFTKPTVFKKNICGDLFGNSNTDGGFLYASRNQKVGGVFGETLKKGDASPSTPVSRSESKCRRTKQASFSPRRLILANSTSSSPSFLSFSPDPASIFDSETGYWTDTSNSDQSEVDDSQTDKMSDDQRLARTLNNWCIDPSNTSYMMNEGGLQSLITLSQVDDRMIKRDCAQAFHRLCSRHEIREVLLKTSGLVPSLISLAYKLKSPKRGLDCARAIVSLCLVPESEELLVEEGSVSAFMALMSLGATTVAPVCVQGLFNLTCTPHYYPNIEKVIKSIAK